MNLLIRLGQILLTSIVILIVVGTVAFYRRDIPVNELKAKYANAASRFVTVDGLSVHYRAEGTPARDSVPLVLLHGTGASLLTWDGWVRDLGTDRRMIRLDLPAHGLTGPNATNSYSGDYYVRFLTEFLDKTGVRQCDLGGNSLGGAVAWRFALAHPGRVRRLVLVDAGGYPAVSKSVPLAFQLARIPVINRFIAFLTPRSIVEQSLKNVYADDSRVTPQLVDQYMDMALRTGNRRAFVSRMTAPPDSAWQRIGQIRQPTLILWGQQDRLIPVQNAYRFQRDLPNDTLVIMPNAGHVPMEERPHESARIVRAFLKILR
ncbi:alpha/beta fold hydrolase [Spirosoma montaniterrae]|uniref:Alpha/beta hydrolase n=1 Tax=Spirosoma montaniterrae TaxID=1178516 RepID=A0A1P9WWG4_9BACT|nr:alpha/beta hydrolase [Spirosoma montaniterrae]AQG79714.1 alpha/beta hydrolase [Spirosoma montaniterrae]